MKKRNLRTRYRIAGSIGLFLLLAGLLLAAVPARAQNELSLRLNSSFYSAPGLDLVSESDHLLQAELSYGRELLALWRGSLWAEASYQVGSSHSNTVGGQLQSKALFQTITLGVLYRLPVWSWLVPHARVGLGVVVGSLGVTPRGGAEAFDRSAAAAGHLLVGAELLWPRVRAGQRGVNFGLVIEGGYGFGGPLAFELEPSGPDDLRLIPGRGADLGSLVLQGAQLRVGAVLRF